MKKFVTSVICLVALICGMAGRVVADAGDCLQWLIYEDTPTWAFFVAHHYENQPGCDDPNDAYVWADPTIFSLPEPCGNCTLKRLVAAKTNGQGNANQAKSVCKGLSARLPINHAFKDTMPSDARNDNNTGGKWHPKNGISVLMTKWVYVEQRSGDPIAVKLYKHQMDYKAGGLDQKLWPGGKQFGSESWIGFEMRKMPNSQEETAPVLTPTPNSRPCQFMGTVMIDESTKPVVVLVWENHPLFAP